MRLLKKRAQATAEFAIIIALIVIVAIVMQIYVKRGMQGRMKDATDKYVNDLAGDSDWNLFNTTTTATLAPQWEFDKYTGKRTRQTVTGTKTQEDMTEGGKVTRTIKEITTPAAKDFQKYDYTR
jgi:hypothetical protein